MNIYALLQVVNFTLNASNTLSVLEASLLINIILKKSTN